MIRDTLICTIERTNNKGEWYIYILHDSSALKAQQVPTVFQTPAEPPGVSPCVHQEAVQSFPPVEPGQQPPNNRQQEEESLP